MPILPPFSPHLRHVVARREGNDPADAEVVTYGELLKDVCRVANVLKAKGVAKGDRVAIYMPMVKHLVVAMLAVARIGAVHSIVVNWDPSVDVWWHEALSTVSSECDPVWMDTEDPLFMLYTSFTTPARASPRRRRHVTSLPSREAQVRETPRRESSSERQLCCCVATGGAFCGGLGTTADRS
ncbi:Acetyl-coenzyme A synthetase, cytoplasmic [Portunus trituberculatus]|uniref:acetate--CoA ligase n=1 Tax=Portunus trituberculatus TaxID=210409 RepID=A0A5B7D1R1_PORTR|nr:Acetyl-coenzyme A synthetase, cytoplasmic [Portunus trituberculatus]